MSFFPHVIIVSYVLLVVYVQLDVGASTDEYIGKRVFTGLRVVPERKGMRKNAFFNGRLDFRI